MKEKVKRFTGNYYKPTPKVWRKIGDSLLAMSVFMIGSAVYLELGSWVVITSLLLGVGGTFLTNFFAE